jgi:hypothetical protein
MNADQSQPISSPAPATSADTPASESLSPETTPGGVPKWLPLWLLTLGAGLVSGLVSWAGSEPMVTMFPIQDEVIYPANYQKIGGYQKQAVNAEILGAAQRVVARKQAAASFGLLGLVLAAGLGLIGGLAAGSPRTAVLVALGGGLMGAAAGGGLSWAVVPIFSRYQTPDSGLRVLFLTHAAIFTGVGALSGLALGLGLGDRLAMGRALFGGLLGSFLGTIALEVVNSLAFPLMPTLEPIAPEPTPRLVTYLCVAVFTALLTGWAAGGDRERFRRKASAEG